MDLAGSDNRNEAAFAELANQRLFLNELGQIAIRSALHPGRAARGPCIL
jgi:hypothetical protein